ncbi:MAG: L,D-transpeptidase family protein [Candidatus Eremiobacteraeota bacterium]|nr:L,D-transpeptidase family protein [Candidatus Eremiobacteraeota bacterium]
MLRHLVKLSLLALLACSTPPPAIPSPAATTPSAIEQPSPERAGDQPHLKVEVRGPGQVLIEYSGGQLVRSLTPLTFPNPPATELEGDSPYLDQEVASGVTYQYSLVDGEQVLDSSLARVPPKKLPPLHHPRLVVDKVNYTLSVYDRDERVKRYPFVMGGKPRQRKLCRDNASTPEGIYTIYNLQPQATFYRAYDIDYPNPIDRFRYTFAQRHLELGDPGIGGEIQIHGCGLNGNWTAGCMALRDADMDELFAQPALAAGTRVWIVGREMTMADLEGLSQEHDPEVVRRLQTSLGLKPDGQMGQATREALGLYQHKQGWPVTCQLDQRSLNRLLKQ